jgi:hypothetical protein
MNVASPDLQADFDDRLRFEMLLTELSARFVSVTPAPIGHEIIDAQRRIVATPGRLTFGSCAIQWSGP